MALHNNDLVSMFDAQWKSVKDALRTMKEDMSRAARQERAEVAGSVPVYATTGDFPTAGQVGRLAAAADTGKLYFDDGSSWREVTLV